VKYSHSREEMNFLSQRIEGRTEKDVKCGTGAISENQNFREE
jgi:hypothetical protein